MMSIRNLSITCTCIGLALGAAYSPVRAQTLTGQIVNVDPPPMNTQAGMFENNAALTFFAENEGVELLQNLTVDISVADIPFFPVAYNAGNPPPSNQIIPAGTLVDSFFIHHDATVANTLFAQVTFDNPIVGIALRPDTLNGSVDLLGLDTNTYQSTGGFGLNFGSDQLTLLNPNTLIINSSVSAEGVDDLRVLTLAPPPPDEILLEEFASLADLEASKGSVNTISEVEVRMGANRRRGDFELAISENGANSPLAPENQGQLRWRDEKEYRWDLAWNPSLNTATFTVANPGGGAPVSIEDTFFGENDIFNAFSIFAKAKTEDPFTVPDTEISFGIDTINGEAVNLLNGGIPGSECAYTDGDRLLVSALSPEPDGFQVLNQCFFASVGGEEILSAAGIFSLNYPGGPDNNPQDNSARSRITVGIKLLDPPGTSGGAVGGPQSVPESPASIVGLLSLGAFSAVLKMKQRR